MKIENFPIHFICGMSRSGTTWMSHCLNMHKECATFGETLFWGRNYVEPQGNGRYRDEIFRDLVSRISDIKLDSERAEFGKLKTNTLIGWSQDMPKYLLALEDKTPVNLFKMICQFVINSEGKRVAIEKTPHHVNWIPRINKVLPDSRFIVMVREPYGFMRSYKYQGLQAGERVRRIFERQYHPVQAALVWRGYAKSIIRATEDYSDKVIVIRNEQLIDDPRNVLKRVSRFLGLSSDDISFDTIPARANSSIVGASKLELDSADYFWMNLIARKQIKNLGYDINNSPYYFVEIVTTFIKLPLWIFRTIYLLNNNSNSNIFKYIFRWLK